MKIRINSIDIVIPDEVLETTSSDISRCIAEKVALEAYKSGQFSESQLRRFLGFKSRMQVDQFLKDHEVYLPQEYILEELKLDRSSREKLKGL